MHAYEDLLERYAELNALNKAIALLNWDRQTMMPAGGDDARTAHVKHLSRLVHQWYASDEIQRLAGDADAGGDPVKEASIRVLRRDIKIQNSLPESLVVRKAEVSGKAYIAWRKARSESNFSILAPFLEELFDIAGETASARGYKNHIYDPLVDLFEEGATHSDAHSMFSELLPEILKLLDAIRGSQVEHDDTALIANWDQARLRNILQKVTEKIGFDYSRGRLDTTSNAFCTNFSVGDVRMTTRSSDSIKGILFSSLHEMGHGLYEQNQPRDWDRLPVCGGISMAVHESQSRFWENTIGRSLPFWLYFYPMFLSEFPELEGITAEEFYRKVNKVKPGPVRIGSDELTYNIHIMIRFELECELLLNKIQIADLPDAWNSKTEKYLGILPADDGEGCLQDVHWSRGSVGYFPTYAMGNLIGWQIWDTLLKTIPHANEQIQSGNFSEILGFLTKEVYSKGKLKLPKKLVLEITGNEMNTKSYLNHMNEKYSSIYNLSATMN